MKRIPGIKPLHIEKDATLWACRGLKLFRSNDLGQSFQFLGSYQGSFTQRISHFNRLFERFTRSGLQSLVPLSDGSCLATARGYILKLDAGSKKFRQVFTISRGSRPLNICKFPNGKLAWGEYFFNKENKEVHIYASEDKGESWHVVYTFPAGDIRHVHGIYYDSLRNGAWIITGDTDEQSKIIFTTDSFDNLETVFAGSQDYRSAFILPVDDKLLIGGDSPYQKNFIQLLDPKSSTVKKVQPIDGSAFYGTTVGDWIVVSVAAEPSKINKSPYASLWISQNGYDWQKLYQVRRDRWQMPYNRFVPDSIAELPLFQHAVFVLPTSASSKSDLFAFGQALREDDGCMLYWDLNRLSDKPAEKDGDSSLVV